MDRYSCDVCIVGAGTAGMAAAYALTQYPSCKVILVDDNDNLGGTAVCSWVGTWIEGITPPYLQTIMRNLGITQGQIDNSILPAIYGGIGGNIYLSPDKLSEQYKNDMMNAPNVCVYSGWSLMSITEMRESSRDIRRYEICEIELIRNTLNDREDNTEEKMRIRASYFIDSTGDGLLCRLACPNEGEDYYVGEDPYERFNEALMKDNKKPADEKNLDEPSLLYKIADAEPDDTPILDKVESVYLDADGNVIHPSYINIDGYACRAFLNPMTGFGITGYDVVVRDKKELYDSAVSRITEHWKYVKLSLKKAYKNNQPIDINKCFHGYQYYLQTWNYTNKYASKLGVRESYRIVCDYMLRQEDLFNLIDPDKLEHYIACGSHIIDFHVYGTLDQCKVTEYNKFVVPSGIPYESLCPQKLANTLIACRAYGASHIALAARRVNKDMAQLGWVAGYAISQCIQSSGTIRNVDINKIQTETGFMVAVRLLRTIYKRPK